MTVDDKKNPQVSADGVPDEQAEYEAKSPSSKLKTEEEEEQNIKSVLNNIVGGEQSAITGRRCEDSRRNRFKEHPFWDTQPVPKMVADKDGDEGSETIEEVEVAKLVKKMGPIDDVKKVEDVQQNPYNLPGAFEWCLCDVTQAEEIQEIYELLRDNYVEDDDAMFRFEYSKEFLIWALTPPEYLKEWHLGVRVKASQKLVAFISGIPATMRIHKTSKIKTSEINFLCVHKKLRSKRLAPVLIKEITRRVNLLNIWQAVYTAGVVLPKPIAECRYWHRSLNPKKLIEVGFSHLQPRMTIARTVKLCKLPEEQVLEGFRVMTSKDVAAVHKLLVNYLKKFGLHPELTQADVRHWVLPRDGVVFALVRETTPKEGEKGFGGGKRITDVCSFYRLPSTILGHEKYNSLDAAYSYWNVCTTCTWIELMNEALIFAKNNGLDVFNALDIMDNVMFLKDLKFGVGDGYLQYYMFNWKCPKLKSDEVGLVLL